MNALSTITVPILSPYQRAKVLAVIERIELHGSMRKACGEVGMAHPTFFDWIDLDASLRDRYARARKVGTLALVDNAFEQATDPDLPPKQVQRARLAWDATKWLAAHQDPDTFGDKMRTELTGKDGAAIAVETSQRDPIVSELAALLRQAKRPGAVTIEGSATRIEPRAPDDISDLI